MSSKNNKHGDGYSSTPVKADTEVMVSSPNIEEFDTFDQMSLPTALLRGIYSYGFENPSSIQKKAIVPFSKGSDMIAQSQSGTGKTGAFSIGCLSRIDANCKEIQAIIISPTRELAIQTTKVFTEIGSLLNLNIYKCIGGTSISEDIDGLTGRRLLSVHLVVFMI